MKRKAIELTATQKILDSHSNVLGNLSQQYRGKIASRMKGHGRASSIKMPKLFVRAALTNLLKPQLLKNRNDLARFKNRNAGHLRNFDGLNPNELRLNIGCAIAAQQFDDFLQIGIEFVKGTSLRMCTGKTGNVANEKAGIRATLYNGGIGFHEFCSYGLV